MVLSHSEERKADHTDDCLRPGGAWRGGQGGALSTRETSSNRSHKPCLCTPLQKALHPVTHGTRLASSSLSTCLMRARRSLMFTCGPQLNVVQAKSHTHTGLMSQAGASTRRRSSSKPWYAPLGVPCKPQGYALNPSTPHFRLHCAARYTKSTQPRYTPCCACQNTNQNRHPCHMQGNLYHIRAVFWVPGALESEGVLHRLLALLELGQNLISWHKTE